MSSSAVRLEEYRAVFDTGYDWESDAIQGTDSDTMTGKFGSVLRS